MRILNVSQNYFVVGGMDVAMFTLEGVLRAHGHAVIPFAAADAQNAPTPYARYFPPAPRTEATSPKALTLRGTIDFLNHRLAIDSGKSPDLERLIS